jgi:hypothetical protein
VHERDLCDGRRERIGVRADSAGAQRIDVLRADTLGEVDVTPVAADIAEQLVAADDLVRLDCGVDVPVAELVLRADLDGDRLGRVEEDLAAFDRVHRRSVRGRDVDAEVEGKPAVVADPRVVEEGADGMLPVEWLDRPVVGRGQGRRAPKGLGNAGVGGRLG